MQQNRFRSPALWVSVAALITFCLKEFFQIDLGATLSGLLDVLLPVLVGFGIINDPTSKDSL